MQLVREESPVESWGGCTVDDYLAFTSVPLNEIRTWNPERNTLEPFACSERMLEAERVRNIRRASQVAQPLRIVWREELENLIANRDFVGAHLVQQKILIREELEAKMMEHSRRKNPSVSAIFVVLLHKLQSQYFGTQLVELQQLACLAALIEKEDPRAGGALWRNFEFPNILVNAGGDEAEARKYLVKNVEVVIEALAAQRNFAGAQALQQQLEKMEKSVGS